MTRMGFSGTRSYEFSKYLVRKSHQVVMMCLGVYNEKALTVPSGSEYIEVELDGIHMVPIAAAYADPQRGTHMSGRRRMWHFMHFARLAARVGRKLARPGVIVATHTPLTIGLAGVKLGAHFNVPFVFEARDFWPEAPAADGYLKSNGLQYKFWEWLESFGYAQARKILSVSRGFHNRLLERAFPRHA